MRDGVLLIDELESALHVSVLDSVLEMLKWATEKYNVQVFASTHSLEAVDSVLKAFPEAGNILVAYRLERTESNILAKRFPHDLLRTLRFDMGGELR